MWCARRVTPIFEPPFKEPLFFASAWPDILVDGNCDLAVSNEVSSQSTRTWMKQTVHCAYASATCPLSATYRQRTDDGRRAGSTSTQFEVERAPGSPCLLLDFSY
jgi:hypothetical protein